jgi:hypothetical protein
LKVFGHAKTSVAGFAYKANALGSLSDRCIEPPFQLSTLK